MSFQGSTPEAEHMLRALALARRSRPSPNPRVGAVIVNNGEVVGSGYHERPGMPHAEIVALREAKDKARGADLYVTLEPCCHVGRTGPCTEPIASAGIRRVFVGIQDPDLKVNGNGVACLVAQGIEVHCGVEEEACARLLSAYTHQRRTGRPLVTLKAAISLDGYLATASRQSKWISGEASRAMVHELRAECDAVLVGVGTVLADDPLLTVRQAPGESPVRVVLDSRLKTPCSSQLVRSAGESPVVIVHTAAAPKERRAALQACGVELLACLQDEGGRVQLSSLLDELGRRGILSLLVEGGSQVHGAFISQGLAGHLALFIAPRVFGAGIPWNAFPGVENVADAVVLHQLSTRQIGDDLLVEGRFVGQTPR